MRCTLGKQLRSLQGLPVAECRDGQHLKVGGIKAWIDGLHRYNAHGFGYGDYRFAQSRRSSITASNAPQKALSRTLEEGRLPEITSSSTILC
jgi:hypothetical protein